MTDTEVTHYLRCGLVTADRNTAVELAMQAKWPEFDAFVVTGISGIAFGSVLAHQLGKHLLVVRKGESSHSGHEVEGVRGPLRYIFLDDLVSTGGTFQRVLNAMKKPRGNGVPDECVGVYLYADFHPASYHFGYPVIPAPKPQPVAPPTPT